MRHLHRVSVAMVTGVVCTVAVSACQSDPTPAATRSTSSSSHPTSTSSSVVTTNSSSSTSTAPTPNDTSSSTGTEGMVTLSPGAKTGARIAVPAGWKPFTRVDFTQSARMQEMATLTGVSTATLRQAITDKVDTLVINPTKDHGTTDNISLGTTTIPNSEGIPDETVARLKAERDGETFISFRTTPTRFGQASLVETASSARGGGTFTQVDFLVPGGHDMLDEVVVSTRSQRTAETLAAAVAQSYSR